MKKLGIAAIIIFFAMQLPGCLGVYKFEMPIVHYQLKPEVVTFPCEVRSEYILKVAPVLVTPPYDGTRLMYSSRNFKIEPSVYYQWIAAPDIMIRDYLVRSLKTLSTFGNVITREGVLRADYVLDTHVSRLDCMKTDQGHMAHVEANIVLIKKRGKIKDKPEICFKKNYNILEEIPGGRQGPPEVNDVVMALNKALKTFSMELQKDLCNYFEMLNKKPGA